MQDDAFDLVWSQDSFLHSGNREQAVKEIDRVIDCTAGTVIFTDPMAADSVTDSKALQPILQRLHLGTMGCPSFYRQQFEQAGFKRFQFDDQTDQLVNHYSKVLSELQQRAESLQGKVSQQYIDDMQSGLQHWIAGGKAEQLSWGIFVVQR